MNRLATVLQTAAASTYIYPLSWFLIAVRRTSFMLGFANCRVQHHSICPNVHGSLFATRDGFRLRADDPPLLCLRA